MHDSCPHNRVVLITGGSGAVGSALAPLFLAEPQTRVYLLLRAQSDLQLVERLKLLCDFWQISSSLYEPGKLCLLRGDVTLPRLGLGEQEYCALTSELTHIVHAAGNVKLNQSMQAARDSAVAPVREICELARRSADNGRFRKVEYVSTVGVAGRWPGNVPEQLNIKAPSFRNTYEAAKAEAEQALLSVAADKFACTVHRPSMVVGSARDGKIVHFQVFYHLIEFFAGRKTRGVIPNAAGYTLDIIPADYVAAAIHLSTRLDETAGRVLHLCSGPKLALDMMELADRARGFFKRCGSRPPARIVLPCGMFRCALPLLAAAAPLKSRRALGGLHYLLEYLREKQCFENKETDALLSAHELQGPIPQDYLDVVLDYYWRRNEKRIQ